MSKTWYGHYIENIKGQEYIKKEDYDEVVRIIDRLKKWLDDKIKWNEYLLKEESLNPEFNIFAFNRNAYIDIWKETKAELKRIEEGKL